MNFTQQNSIQIVISTKVAKGAVLYLEYILLLITKGVAAIYFGDRHVFYAILFITYTFLCSYVHTVHTIEYIYYITSSMTAGRVL